MDAVAGESRREHTAIATTTSRRKSALLINAHQAITAAGGRLRLAALTQPVLCLLQIVGVDAVLSLHPTREDALAPPPAA